MTKLQIAVYTTVLALLIGLPHAAVCQDKGPLAQNAEMAAPPPPPPMPPPEPAREINAPPLKMIEPGVYEIGGVRILKKENQVQFTATVNMDKGLLEYAIVGATGKVHESLLGTSVEPYALQIALLLVGLEGSSNPLSAQGDPRKPEGDPVSIWVQWKDGDQVKKVRIEEWIMNKSDGNPMKPMNWIFTGSVITEGVFLAQVEKSIVAIFHDPVALIDNPLPEGGSDEVWFVNEGKVPAVGTEVTVIIKKEAKKAG